MRERKHMVLLHNAFAFLAKKLDFLVSVTLLWKEFLCDENWLTDDAFAKFTRLKELHTIAPAAAGEDAGHSPYMISLVVRDSSDILQLLSKGSPDLILAHCSSMCALSPLSPFKFSCSCLAYRLLGWRVTKKLWP